MGMALAVILLVCILFAMINQDSEESAAITSQTKKLPEGAMVFFDQRVSGRSRKGVVTYYSHFVRAVCTSPDGTSQQETFPFNHHDIADKAAAWGKAHTWAIDTHKNLVAESLKQADSDEVNGDKDLNLASAKTSDIEARKDRYDRTIKG